MIGQTCTMACNAQPVEGIVIMLRLMLLVSAAALALSACGEEPAPAEPRAPVPSEDRGDPGADTDPLTDPEPASEQEDGTPDDRTPGEIALAEDPDWPPFEETSPEVTEEDFHYWIRTLADDRFEGRAPGTETGEASAQWIADNLERMGLQPAGTDGWFQPVPLIEATLDQERSSMDIAIDGQPMGLQIGRDSVFWTENPEELVTVENSELVFVGYGVNAPEYGWNDYEGVDVTGKTVVILVNDPGFANPDDEDFFNGPAMTYYGRWTYKYEEAARQGAAGAIIVHQTEPASYGWDVVASSWTGPQFTLQREGELELVPVQGWIQLDVARTLFEAVGLDFDEQAEAAAGAGFEAVSMEGAEMSAELHTSLNYLSSNNVVGVIEGTERPDEYLILTAHWDHLGTRLNFASDDDIYNGAVDNATGSAAVLEIAEAIARGEPLERSVLAIFVTAEEQGLLGSAWYAENPTVPLSSIVGGFNFDAMLPVGRTEDIVVIGYGSSEMEDILQEVVESQGRYLSPDPAPEGGFFYRSDHISFARRGVPMLYAKDGSVHVERGADYVEQRATAYRLNAYHAPADQYNPDWDMSGLVENTQTALEVIRRLGDSEDWPNWYEGNEFRSVRDAMMQD
jgi:Zn-dependent M28 family amino/carboxypeptidase